MRKPVLITILGIGALASIALCGSYGWDQATEAKDRVIQAFVYGFVALATLALHGLALRAWVSGWRKSGAFIGVVAMLAFVMTAFTSLGGLASRSDKVLAERQDVLDNRADVKRRIDELLAEKATMRFVRTTHDAVDAARLVADAATRAREQECGRLGENCRKRQDTEGTALTALAMAQTNKAGTDRFEKIETELKRLRSPRTEGVVGAADPLKTLLSTIIGSWADLLAAWQKAVFAVIYDLVLVALMIGIEVTGERKVERQRDEEGPPAVACVSPPRPISEKLPPLPRPKLATVRRDAPAAPIPRIMTAALDPAKGHRVDLEEAFAGYCAASKAEGREPVSPDVFMDAMARFCKLAKIRTKVVDNRLVLLDVQLAVTPPQMYAD